MVYPQHGDPAFADTLVNMKEYQVYKAPPLPVFNTKDEFDDQSTTFCSSFEKATYQHFIQHYLSRRSPYRSVLLYHGLGVGKTCSAITVAESLLQTHNASNVIVISSEALHKSFEDQLFSMSKLLAGKSLDDQCTGDFYKKVVYGVKGDTGAFRKKLAKIIKSRYTFLTYDRVATFLKNDKVKDAVIIVDEVHNLRQLDKEKLAAKALEQMISSGERNRLVLMSATPMYNEPDEIFWMLNLLLKNDKRPALKKIALFKANGEQNKRAFNVLSQLASEYISYIKGGSPFTMPVRLPPSSNGYLPLQGFSDLESIREYILPSYTASKFTKQAAKKNFESAQNFQHLNAFYPEGKTGDKGFSSVFTTVDTVEPIQVSYIKKHNNYFNPSSNLESVAPKIKKITDSLIVCEGIVIIYSQFVYGGILPIAVALEHLGCKRFGQRGLTRGIDRIDSSISGMSYAIICGDHKVMGSTSISDILNATNSDANVDGSTIKVVLITPIAGEGLNFKNVREVHILEPWYHMNAIEQVIGRAARTCSHMLLPLEKRNVTVNLHVCVNKDGTETADIHAYSIAARKLNQTSQAEKVIMDSALDCALMANLNFYPKDNFKFAINLQTSHGKQLVYHYGNNDHNKPQCVHKITKRNQQTFRTDLYHGLISSIESKILRIVKKSGDTKYFPIDTFLTTLKTEPEIVLTALQNVATNSNGTLALHMNNLIVYQPADKQKTWEISIESTSQAPVEHNVSSIIPATLPSDENVATIMLYTSIDSHIWPTVALEMIKGHHPAAASIMAKNGALVCREELPRFKSSSKYIGYCDIFDTKNLSVNIVDNGVARDASNAELRQIKAGRYIIELPENIVYGILFPTGFRKDAAQALNNKLKLFVPGPNTRGAMCAPKKVKELNDILESVSGHRKENQNRDELCYTISVELIKSKQLFTYPLWKPNK